MRNKSKIKTGTNTDVGILTPENNIKMMKMNQEKYAEKGCYMKKRIKLYWTYTLLLLLNTYASAQQPEFSNMNNKDGRCSIELCKEHLIGKVAASEVYLYSENDLMQSGSDTVVWFSAPDSVIFIKKENAVECYSSTSELSLAIYGLLTHFEEFGKEENLHEIIKMVLRLVEKKEDINEIKYEQVGDDLYGYWIYNWLHYYVRHEYGYRASIKQNMQYSPVYILHLSSLEDSEFWNKKVMKWQQTTYGRISQSFNIYPLKGSLAPDKYLLLESIFENDVIRYDLILEYKKKYHFFLSSNSFSALVSEFSKIFEESDFVNIVKGLCLIDMFYQP